jgi:hypothetical protein
MSDVMLPPPPPPAAPDAPIDQRVLNFLKSNEPFSTLLKLFTANANGANTALAGGQPALPPEGLKAPAVLDPTVKALRDGSSASTPNP